MAAGSVVYSRSIRCVKCGLLASGYMQVSSDGNWLSTCPRCGASIVQPPQPGRVVQMPHQPYHTHSTHDRRRSAYPDLYNAPKHAPKLDLRNMLRIPLHPTKALTELYRSTEMRWALVIVILSSVLYSVVSALVTTEMYDVIGMGYINTFEAGLLASVGLIVSVVSFLIFSVMSSVVASELFGGRGDKGSTVTLVGYCYPWFVCVSTLILAIFVMGFNGLELGQVNDWSDAEVTRAIVWGACLLVAAVSGLIWLLFLAGKAIGVANDVSTGEGAMSAVIGAICAGLVSVVVGMVLRLPIGLSF
jgi:hypothetical protein